MVPVARTPYPLYGLEGTKLPAKSPFLGSAIKMDIGLPFPPLEMSRASSARGLPTGQGTKATSDQIL